MVDRDKSQGCESDPQLERSPIRQLSRADDDMRGRVVPGEPVNLDKSTRWLNKATLPRSLLRNPYLRRHSTPLREGDRYYRHGAQY
jgi:hypothetical protein